MSTHELEHTEEQRSGFTGVRLGELKEGSIIYIRRAYHFHRLLLCRLIMVPGHWGGYRFDIAAIGRGKYHFWGGILELMLLEDYSQTPSDEYLVVNGLGLPDELMYEVYLYVD